MQVPLASIVRVRGVRATKDHRDEVYIGLEHIEPLSGKRVGQQEGESPNEGSLFEEGDVLFGRLRPYLRKVWLADLAGKCAGELEVLVSQSTLTPRYLKYCLLGEEIGQFASGASQGTKMPRISWQFLRRRYLHLPPLRTQSAIADYLDRETARLDTLIEAKGRQISLVEEKWWAALVDNLGQSPGAVRKASGLAWLPRIPIHWDVRPVKYVARIESGHTPKRSVQAYWDDGEIPWVSLADSHLLRKHDTISDPGERMTPLGLENSSARLLPTGSVVFSRDATVGLCAVTTCPMTVSQHFIAWVPTGKMVPEFLYYAVLAMKPHLESITQGTTIPTIGMPHLRAIKTPVPPLAEQKAIVDKMKGLTLQKESTIARIQRSIDLLRERRQALITAAVTGELQIPVPEAP